MVEVAGLLLKAEFIPSCLCLVLLWFPLEFLVELMAWESSVKNDHANSVIDLGLRPKIFLLDDES